MNGIREHLRPSFAPLFEAIAGGKLPCAVFRAAEGLRPYLLHEILKTTQRSVLFVVGSDYEARQLYDACLFDERVYLPAPSVELSRVETRSNEVSAARVAALSELLQGPRVVFLSVDALLYKMRPKDGFCSRFLQLRAGQELSPKELTEKLTDAGYEHTSLVEGKGQCAGRGEILDLFAPNRQTPLRITYFDDEIESIRAFDPDTQRSYGAELEEVSIAPACEFCLSSEEKQVLETYLEQNAEGERQRLAQRLRYELSEQGIFANMEAFSGLFADAKSLADWAEDPLIVCSDLVRLLQEQEKKIQSRTALFAEVLQTAGAFGCENDCYFDLEGFLKARESQIIDLAGLDAWKGFSSVLRLEAPVRSAVGFNGNFEMLASSVAERAALGWQVYLFAGGRAKNLSTHLSDAGVDAPVTQGQVCPGVSVVGARLAAGFSLDEEKALYLSELEIFGNQKARKDQKKKTSRKQLDLLADLQTGDIVVHEIHGKGRFTGLKTMDVGGVSSDYMEIEYRDGDKLYIQTSQIDRVQKYIGPGDEASRLSKLGGKEWEGVKAKARSAIKELTEDLVSLYSERAAGRGYAFSEDSVWQRQFEDNFAFEETPGQSRSIEQIKRDMCSEKIMDRLLLGDVGYGKTEVAMRACFKAVLDSKQTAVLVPTTLLARQHLKTFQERFAGFPVRIAMLSRFTKDSAKVLKEVEDGTVDIVIGTHRLLSKNVKFKDLGLLVIDEEQRFGVSHKERIKDVKRQVDVLTLSATPIPRTLEMAMSGIRDMSTIDTPPTDRKEVQSYVAEFSWNLVREAILKELNRGGQAYFVCRRIGQMDELARMLKHVVPEARVAQAHGQMTEAAFEKVVCSFLEREYDVLLCTTIIESGIDIPSVNTIFVYEADKFGLSQLYQLKGRVGRSNLRAYAYFTHLGADNMGETAQKRLSAIREFTQFGSGFKIAMRDLEIRGAGNILGAEQSGHMDQIGYHLYCKFVRQEVDGALGKTQPVQIDTAVELGRSAYIPGNYISDEAQKLEIYRSIAAIGSIAEAKETRQMLTDRFGAPPREVENLMLASLIRSFAGRAAITSVIVKPGIVEMKFSPDADLNLKKLMRTLEPYKTFATFRPSDPPAILLKPVKGLFTEMLQLLGQIRRCTRRPYQV